MAPRYAVVIALTISGCSTDWLPHVDLAPTYEPPEYVVPVSWKGSSPFVEASPSDGELRSDWWMLLHITDFEAGIFRPPLIKCGV